MGAAVAAAVVGGDEVGVFVEPFEDAAGAGALAAPGAVRLTAGGDTHGFELEDGESGGGGLGGIAAEVFGVIGHGAGGGSSGKVRGRQTTGGRESAAGVFRGETRSDLRYFPAAPYWLCEVKRVLLYATHVVSPL